VPGEDPDSRGARREERERPPRPAVLTALDQRVDEQEHGGGGDQHAAAVEAAQGGRAVRGHGGVARVALTSVPGGPNAVAITRRVRELLAEGGVPEGTVPAALDLLGLFVTAAALDRVPVAMATAEQHRRHLQWEIDVILTGLTTAGPPGG